MINNRKMVVVLPAYNAENTLKQTYNEIPFDIVDEVILTDDFSNDNTVEIEEGTNGWEKIQMEFFVSSDLINQELTIYTYNPHPDPVYFDDLEIIRYKSIIEEFDNSAKDIDASKQ